MKIIALYSIKGGVGKTAACVNLAFLSAREGYRTLLIDLDPQGSASYYFRISAGKKFTSKKFLKGGKPVEKKIRGTDFENLDAIPSALSFRKMDITLDGMRRSRKRLKDLLVPMAESYDLIFLDCPPNITLLSENVFVAADVLLVPLVPTTLAEVSYEKMLAFMEKKSLDLTRVFPFFSMVEGNKKMHRQIIERLSKSERRMMAARIPYNSDVEKMGIYRKPVACTARGSRAAEAYQALWLELRQRIEKSGGENV